MTFSILTANGTVGKATLIRAATLPLP